MNPVSEYRFLLGQYFCLAAQCRKPGDLSKILERLDELWDVMTQEQHRSIWK